LRMGDGKSATSECEADMHRKLAMSDFTSVHGNSGPCQSEWPAHCGHLSQGCTTSMFRALGAYILDEGV
jgi:hypothetical protein